MWNLTGILILHQNIHDTDNTNRCKLLYTTKCYHI